MPTSEKQKGAAGAAYGAVKKGTAAVNKLKGPAKSMAKSMSKPELKKMATGPIKKEPVKESITMQQPVMQQMQQSYEHPGCEDTIGDIFVVMKPGPEDTPEKLVQPTHAFGMQQFDPMQVHGVYNDQEEANMVAEAACNELYKHMKEVEDKKHSITEKIGRMIKEMQKQVNRHMQEGNEGGAQETLQKISSLRERHKMVQASKKEIKPLEEKK
jgi:hypothetical protein